MEINKFEVINDKKTNPQNIFFKHFSYKKIHSINISCSLMYLIVFLLFFFLHVIFSYSIIKQYFPTQDTLSFIINSTHYISKPDIVSWFTEGLTKYFIFCPEWSQNFSNYIRPVCNFVFFIEYILWGENWGGYIVFNYFINSCGILVVFITSYKYFKLSFFTSLIASFIMFLTSFRLYIFYYPAYIFDAMAAVFLGVAFLLILKKKYVWTALALTAALFTKEFAIFGPFAAIVTYLIIDYQENKQFSKNTIIPLFVLLTPVVIWFSIRQIFSEGLSGNYGYSFMGLPFSFNISQWIHFIVKEIRTLFHWPIGWPVQARLFGAGYEVSDIISGKIFRDFKYIYIIAILNPIFIAWFLYDIFQGFRKNERTRYSYLSFIQLPWIFGIYVLLLLTLDFLGLRYGYSFFMFVIPFSIYMIVKSKIHLRKTLYFSYIVVLSFMGLLSLKDHCFHSDVQIKFYQKAKQVSELIKEVYTEDPTRSVYLINDVSGLWGSYYLGAFASKNKNINFTVLNSVWILEDFLSEEPEGDSYVNIIKNNNIYACSIKIPDNRHFFFYGAAYWKKFLDETKTTENGIVCNRTEKLEYIINLTNEDRRYPFGRKLTINVTGDNPAFIYYNFEDDSYIMYTGSSLP